MKVAIVGSRTIDVDVSQYIPQDTTIIISGGARGVDQAAARYADDNGIRKKIFLPDYEKYGKWAPLKRNQQIVDEADCVVALWDGASHGTKNTINYAKKQGKKVIIKFIRTDKEFCGED